MSFNFKMGLVGVFLVMLAIVFINNAMRQIGILLDEHESVATRVAKCVSKEYKENPERKSIEAYCKAQVRLGEDKEFP